MPFFFPVRFHSLCSFLLFTVPRLLVPLRLSAGSLFQPPYLLFHFPGMFSLSSRPTNPLGPIFSLGYIFQINLLLAPPFWPLCNGTSSSPFTCDDSPEPSIRMSPPRFAFMLRFCYYNFFLSAVSGYHSFSASPPQSCTAALSHVERVFCPGGPARKTFSLSTAPPATQCCQVIIIRMVVRFHFVCRPRVTLQVLLTITGFPPLSSLLLFAP